MDDVVTINSYEVRTSKSGLPIPVVNGNLLHSIYDPEREARSIAEQYKDVLRNKNSILILGLGFGYHVEAILNVLKENHETYSVFVIEPNQNVVNDFAKNRRFRDENLIVYYNKEVSELYRDEDLVKTLLSKPAIIAHHASFNLYQNYFKSFLEYSAPRDIQSIFKGIDSEVLKDSSVDILECESIAGYVDNIKKKRKITNNNDFFWLAFQEIAKEKTKSPEVSA